MGIVSKLLNPDHKIELVNKTKKEYETIRETFHQNQQKLKLLPINEARNRKPNLFYNPVQPQNLDIKKIESISSGFFNNKKTREETFSDKVLKNYEGKTHPSKAFGKFIIENKKYGLFNTALLFELKTEIPGAQTWRIDRAGSAYAVELREPFLDHHLVEFSASLPEKLKINFIYKSSFDKFNRSRIAKRRGGGIQKEVTIFKKIKELLDKNEANDILITGGGIIPEDDMNQLYKIGIGKLFGPGTPVQTTIDFITDWVHSNRR